MSLGALHEIFGGPPCPLPPGCNHCSIPPLSFPAPSLSPSPLPPSLSSLLFLLPISLSLLTCFYSDALSSLLPPSSLPFPPSLLFPPFSFLTPLIPPLSFPAPSLSPYPLPPSLSSLPFLLPIPPLSSLFYPGLLCIFLRGSLPMSTRRQMDATFRHRSHFGSRYTLGCCTDAGLLRGFNICLV